GTAPRRGGLTGSGMGGAASAAGPGLPPLPRRLALASPRVRRPLPVHGAPHAPHVVAHGGTRVLPLRHEAAAPVGRNERSRLLLRDHRLSVDGGVAMPLPLPEV